MASLPRIEPATASPAAKEWGNVAEQLLLALAKPDAAIYEAVERDGGVAPQALLFADDRLDNIEAAQARGWQTHLFEGPEGFAERLVAEGLLSPAEAS